MCACAPQLAILLAETSLGLKLGRDKPDSMCAAQVGMPGTAQPNVSRLASTDHAPQMRYEAPLDLELAALHERMQQQLAGYGVDVGMTVEDEADSQLHDIM
jgi:hypothetical protein